MSEKIYLKVPSKPAAEEVSHGNFSAKLKPQSVIEVTDRRFADWLVREYALAEVDGEDGEIEQAQGPAKAGTQNSGGKK